MEFYVAVTLAVALVASGVCLALVIKITQDLEIITERLIQAERRVRESAKRMEDREPVKAVPVPPLTTRKVVILTGKDRYTMEVLKTDDIPLDFPNDRKEE